MRDDKSKAPEPLVGGSYIVKDGVRTLVEGSVTVDHPEGNRARDAQGKPIALPSDETHFNTDVVDGEAG